MAGSQYYTVQPPQQPYPNLQVQQQAPVGAPAPNTTTGNNWISDHGIPQPPQQNWQFQAYQQPNPAMPPPSSPYDPYNPVPNTPPATPPPNLPGPPGSGGPQQPPNGNFNPFNPNEKNQYGGQQIAGADPSMGDYQSVQNYADQAYQNSRRYLDPQQETQNKRMAQDLINQGIDPNSPQGQQRLKMMGMQQADQNNSAAFNAMQFGQGIQNQMFNQEFQKSSLAGNMQQALWQAQLGASGQGLQKYLGDQANQLGWGGLNNQRYGIDMNYNLGKSGQDLQRYGLDLGNQFNMGQLDLARQGQGWNQMMGLDAMNFRNKSYNDSLGMYQDQLMMSLLGQNPAPGGSQVNPYAPYNQQAGSGNSWWNFGMR